MFSQAISRSFLLLATLCPVLIIGIIGCGGDEDDNEWGRHLDPSKALMVSVSKKDLQKKGVSATIITNNWTFK